jgi:hypothetical protein
VATKRTVRCLDVRCHRYDMTVSEFARLGGYQWTDSFSVRIGLRSTKLYKAIYNKAPRRKRRSIWGAGNGEKLTAWRNKVGVYPCGVLEQAYRELMAEQAKPPEHPVMIASPYSNQS